jgi:hypothetical protein
MYGPNLPNLYQNLPRYQAVVSTETLGREFTQLICRGMRNYIYCSSIILILNVLLRFEAIKICGTEAVSLRGGKGGRIDMVQNVFRLQWKIPGYSTRLTSPTL